MSSILQALNSTNKSKTQIHATSNKLHIRASEIEDKLDILNTTCGNINVSVGDVDVNTDGLETLATAGNATLALINGKITACDTGAVTISSSALPSGGATSALQTSGNTELNNILLELQDIDSSVLSLITPLDDIEVAIQANGTKLDDIVTNTGSGSTPARNVVNVASASSISAGSDVGSGVDMTDYKSAVISGSTTQSNNLEIWVSNDSGTTYRFMESIWTNSDDSGNAYYHKVINNVAGYIKLKLPSSATTATITLDVVRQDW